ncbi:MAG: trypsin-like peptidase domain-containing protein [Candidatus Sabulitectum sp.]|nr:trypsin-like peptidase domain-containing protein [Candidatus Sabulitectum sp.]
MKYLMILFTLFLTTVCTAGSIDQAMVKIYTNSVAYNYYLPWSTDAPMESSGSGCVVHGNMILTNAHVVTDETYLQVRKEGDPGKYQAFVVAVSHEADLALITVDDESFFRGIDPLELGELPMTREEVTVYGYPMGGDALSTTQGVISRIESSRYAHSGLSLLTVQIDAAINPGNSGGPAIIGNKIIGVAMQTMNQAENISYVIPVPVIEHFFNDIEDGKYDGFPSAGFSYQTIRNEAFSTMFGIRQEQTGVMITKLAFGSPAAEVLEPGDILLQIDGRAIAGDGTVELRSGSRTRLDYMVNRHQIGETISLEIIRDEDGIRHTVEMKLNTTLHDLTVVPNKIYDTPPEYFIFGGTVFMPLSLNYLESWGYDWYLNAVDYLTYPFLFDNWRTESREEIVVLTFMLPAEVNTGYESLKNEIIVAVNGVPVRNFSQFVELVDEGTDTFLKLATNLGNIIVLDRPEAIATNDEIMTRYGIIRDRVLR